MDSDIITIDTELLHDSIWFDWEPLWDEVYDNIADKLIEYVRAVLSVSVASTEVYAGTLVIQHGDIPHDLVANGIPVRDGKEWTLAHQENRPACRIIPVTIRSRLHVAKVLQCEYDDEDQSWSGEFKLRLES